MDSVALDPVLEAFRERLLTRRRELLSELASRPEALLHVGFLADDDRAPALHDEFVSLEMNRIVHSELKLIDAALKRFGSGEYGTCEHCDAAISVKRLRAVPWARHCVKCEEEISTLLAAKGDTAPSTTRAEHQWEP
jgi:DnaK suppressor protein